MENLKTIDSKELKEWIDDGKDFVLIDVLSSLSFEGRHLPGAKNVNFQQPDFLKKVMDIVDDKDKPVVVYCSSFQCQLSPAAGSDLVEAGYKDVYHFAGGLADWQDVGYDFEDAGDK